VQGTLAVFLAPDVTPEEEARDLVKQDRFEGWCRNTDMEFTVVNHVDPTQNVVKRALSRAAGSMTLSRLRRHCVHTTNAATRCHDSSVGGAYLHGVAPASAEARPSVD